MKNILHSPPPIRSKYAQIREMLLEQIRQGQIPVGARIPSEPNLCQTLDVSRDTVRKAISGLVRDGILETRPGYGHVVCAMQPTTTIGLLWNFPLFSIKTATSHLLMFNALREQLHQRGWKVRLYLPPVHDQSLGLIDYGKLSRDISRGRFAGLLGAFWPSIESFGPRVMAKDQKIIKQLAQAKIPYVSMRTSTAPASVGTDYHTMVAMATGHFLERGLKRIMLVSYDPPNQQMIEGHRDAYRKAGLQPTDDLYITTLFEDRHGYEVFNRIWTSPNRPDAIIIPDDVTARGAALAAMKLGVRIPEDVQLATLSIKGGEMYFPFPVVRLEIDQSVRAGIAIDMLINLIDNPDAEIPPALLKPRLIDEAAEGVAS